MKKYLIGRIKELNENEERIMSPLNGSMVDVYDVREDTYKEIVGDTHLCKAWRVNKEEIKHIKDIENLHYDINTNVTYYRKDVLYFIEDDMLKEYIDGLKEDKEMKESFNERITNYNNLPWYKKLFTVNI